MRILGLDPGLSTAGLGLIETDSKGGMKALDWLTITTPTALPLSDRLLELATDLEKYLREERPALVVVEQLFFSTNKRTAMDVSQARGVIVVTAKRLGTHVLDCTPLQLKTAVTGDGRADKQQMQAMVKRILNMKETPEPADAADALGLAIYGAFFARTLDSVTEPAATFQTVIPSA